MALVSKTGSYSLVGAPPQPSRDSDGLCLPCSSDPREAPQLMGSCHFASVLLSLSVSHLPCTALLIVPREHGTTARKPTLCVGASKQGQLPGGQCPSNLSGCGLCSCFPTVVLQGGPGESRGLAGQLACPGPTAGPRRSSDLNPELWVGEGLCHTLPTLGCLLLPQGDSLC